MMKTAMSCVCVAAAIGLAACARTTGLSSGRAEVPEPAETPGEAAERTVRALVAADERAYRRVTLIRSPAGYADGCIRWVFASFRLHRAVREHGVTSWRVRDAGWDPNEMLSPGIVEPSDPAELPQVRERIARLEWDIDGDVARPRGGHRIQDNSFGETTVERVDGGWTVVLSDPVGKAPAEDLRRVAQIFNAKADALNAATAKVNARELRTMRDVNQFVKANRPKPRDE